MIRARLLMQQDGDFLGAVRICQTIMAWIPLAGNLLRYLSPLLRFYSVRLQPAYDMSRI